MSLPTLEADLARRDPAVPGLATVLDPEAFVAAIQRAAPAADIRAGHIRYLRYKPHAYCRVNYRLDVAGTDLDLDVRACRPEDLAAIEAGERENGGGPLGAGQLRLDPAAVLVTVFPYDLKLPQLQFLTEATARHRVLRELLPDRPDLWSGELRCLRYRPERRYVAELRVADGEERALLKCYTPKAYKRGKHNATAFEPRGQLQLATVLGWSDAQRLIAFEWLPGHTLYDDFEAPHLDLEAARSTGAALAELHAQEPEGLKPWRRDDEVAALVELANEVGFVSPHLAGRADELAWRLGSRLADAPDLQRPMHGDFSATQVLVSLPQVAIIDLDWAYRGDPAEDLGGVLAHAERHALEHGRPLTWVESLRAALLDGYCQVTGHPPPERIGLYTARGLFRRTRSPIRTREVEWPQRTEALLERAEAAANALV